MGELSKHEGEQTDLLKRTLKLSLVLLGFGVLYYYLAPVVAGLYRTSIDASLKQNFQEIAKAIERYELKGGSFTDNDIEKLRPTYLSEAPNDPWGKPYVYDYFFQRIVSAGRDEELQSHLPGYSDPSLPTKGGDDEIYSLQALVRLVVGQVDSPRSRILRVSMDGVEQQTLEEVDGEIVGFHTQTKAKGVVVAVRQQGKVRLMGRTGDGPLKPLTPGTLGERFPLWYNPASDVVLFEGAEEGGPRQIFKVDVSVPQPVRLTRAATEQVDPAVDASRVIYHAMKVGGHFAIYSFSFTQPELRKIIEKPGADVRGPSPDARGEFLAYLVGEGGAWALEVKNLRAGTVARIDKPVMAGTWIAWSPVADMLAYFTSGPSGPRLTMTHLKTKARATLDLPIAFGRFAWVRE